MKPGPITPATRLLVLLGDPVAHSLSPVLQNAALCAEGLDAVYVALRCDAQDVPSLIRAIARAGGGGNITVPHKATALQAIDRRTNAVERTGACNTFWSESGRVHGDNTDVAGFAAALHGLIPDAAGMRVLLLGAGGAAHAAACALIDAGVDTVDVLNRTTARAARLCTRLDPAGRSLRVVTHIDRAPFDLIVNATSLGLHADDPLPIEPGGLARARALIDLVYRAGGTPLVRQASAAGIRAIDGLEMLLQQGAAAFECWWQRPAPLEAMRRAVAP